LAAKAEQKTKICPYCGNRILLYKSRRVAVADDASEASRLLKILKRKSAEERKH